MMIHSPALGFSSSIDEPAGSLTFGDHPLSTDMRKMYKKHQVISSVERTESSCRSPLVNHKPRPASLSLGSRGTGAHDDRTLRSYCIQTTGDDSDTESYSRFPSRRVPPPLKLRRYSGSSSGQSSPQSGYSSSFFSSRSSPRSSRSSPPSSQGSFSPFPSLYSQRSNLPRIQVSSLLSDPRILSYHLQVIQHPLRAAEFSSSPLSRLPVTPPVIVRLDIQDASGNLVFPEAELPFLIAHLSLYNENGRERVDIGPHHGSSPMLYGNLVSSVEHLEDLQGNRGLFFLFPDFSVQRCGRYQLGVTLLRISGESSLSSSGMMGLAQHGQGLAEARTRVFEVLARHQYAAAPQTRLTQSFIRQGARMFTFVAPRHP